LFELLRRNHLPKIGESDLGNVMARVAEKAPGGTAFSFSITINSRNSINSALPFNKRVALQGHAHDANELAREGAGGLSNIANLPELSA
jgi:hypothetical protein